MDESYEVDELPCGPRKEISREDHELLLQAARALNADFVEVDGEGYGNLNFPDGSTVYAWNSLVHSDDAFNLLVRLKFTVEVFDSAVICKGVVGITSPDGLSQPRNVFAQEVPGDDPAAATRRAITRAAAEIIRFMKFLNEIS
jgi:hypothetical protein